MKLGARPQLHLARWADRLGLTWRGSPRPPRRRVRPVSVMDHVWQIGHIGPPEHEMLEAYTTLGYLAARTRGSSCSPW